MVEFQHRLWPHQSFPPPSSSQDLENSARHPAALLQVVWCCKPPAAKLGAQDETRGQPRQDWGLDFAGRNGLLGAGVRSGKTNRIAARGWRVLQGRLLGNRQSPPGMKPRRLAQERNIISAGPQSRVAVGGQECKHARPGLVPCSVQPLL